MRACCCRSACRTLMRACCNVWSSTPLSGRTSSRYSPLFAVQRCSVGVFVSSFVWLGAGMPAHERYRFFGRSLSFSALGLSRSPVLRWSAALFGTHFILAHGRLCQNMMDPISPDRETVLASRSLGTPLPLSSPSIQAPRCMAECPTSGFECATASVWGQRVGGQTRALWHSGVLFQSYCPLNGYAANTWPPYAKVSDDSAHVCSAHRHACAPTHMRSSTHGRRTRTPAASGVGSSG